MRRARSTNLSKYHVCGPNGRLFCLSATSIKEQLALPCPSLRSPIYPPRSTSLLSCPCSPQNLSDCRCVICQTRSASASVVSVARGASLVRWNVVHVRKGTNCLPISGRPRPPYPHADGRGRGKTKFRGALRCGHSHRRLKREPVQDLVAFEAAWYFRIWL